jgi:hypothetical protein
VHGITEFKASSLAERNHKPIWKKEGKTKSGRIKTRYREAKGFCMRKMKEKPAAC